MDTGVLAFCVTVLGALATLLGLAALATHTIPRLASLAAVAAIVAGATLAASPWLPRAGPAPAEPAVTVDAVTLSADGRHTQRAPLGPPPPMPGREATPITIEATEVEPNDTLPGANRTRPGIAIDGTLMPGDRDWFAVDVAPGRHIQLVASLVTNDASVTMTLLDDSGQPLGIARTIDEVSVRTATLERAATRPRYFVLLMPAAAGLVRYQITLAARRW